MMSSYEQQTFTYTSKVFLRLSYLHWIPIIGATIVSITCICLLVHNVHIWSINPILLSVIITVLVSPCCITSPKTGLYANRHKMTFSTAVICDTVNTILRSCPQISLKQMEVTSCYNLLYI